MDDTRNAHLPAERMLASVKAKADSLTARLASADLCGHPDRPGNHSGYCEECWAIFCEEQGLDTDGDPARWDRLQHALAQLIDDPERRSRTLTRRVKAVKARMIQNLPTYARLHLEAATIAAAAGDARPAEWALSNLTSDGQRAVEITKAAAEGNSGVKVFIGVKVGGIPETTEVIEGEVQGE